MHTMDDIMDEIIVKPKFIKCFITNISVVKKKIELWSQTDGRVGTRVESRLQSFHNYLSDLFAINSFDLKPVADPEVGKYYLTHMKNDLHFYRCVVTHVRPESSQALVSFIDFGNEEWVEYNHLVVLDELFDIQPLAQKFFLADIKPKDKEEWDSDKVIECLKPFLLSTFQCEVIRMTKNTECIRVYDEFFNQPLVQQLQRECDGVLSFDLTKREVLKAMDLTIDNRFRFKEINGNDLQINRQLNDKHSTKPKAITPEVMSLKTRELTAHNMKSENKENVEKPSNLKTKSKENGIENECNESDLKRKKLDVVSTQTQLITEEVMTQTDDLDIKRNKLNENSIETKALNTNETKDLNISPEKALVNGLNESPKNESLFQSKEIENQINGIKQNEENVLKNNEKTVEVNAKTTEIEKVVINGDECVENVETVPQIEEKGDTTDGKFVKSDTNATESETKTTENEAKVVNSKDNAIETNEPKIENKEINLETVSVGGDSLGLLATKNKVYVTCVHSKDSFSVQLASKWDEITALTEEMTQFYDKIYDSKELALNLNEVKINDLIAARFQSDNLWYRALVKEIKGKNLFVFYIDYGNNETIELHNSKLLAQQFKGMTAQAIGCTSAAEISFETLKAYENNMTEIDCEFSDIHNDVFKIKIFSV